MLKECSGKNSLEIKGEAAKTETRSDQLPTIPHAGEESELTVRTVGVGGTVASALANAGRTLEGAEVEFVLNPYRLAFETKDLKILESALDCLHYHIASVEGTPYRRGIHKVQRYVVLDIILRQHAAKKGCLLVRQSFFHNDPKNYADVGGGVLGCRGFHSSFRTTQGGLSLNIDVSTTLVIQPGPVVDFVIANRNVRDPFSIDWAKAKRVLKNLRIKTMPSNEEYKITGLSEKSCKEQMLLKIHLVILLSKLSHLRTLYHPNLRLQQLVILSTPL